MTRVAPSAMMFATVSGCAQTALIRLDRPTAKATAKTAGKSTRRSSKGRAKSGREVGKRA